MKQIPTPIDVINSLSDEESTLLDSITEKIINEIDRRGNGSVWNFEISISSWPGEKVIHNLVRNWKEKGWSVRVRHCGISGDNTQFIRIEAIDPPNQD